MNKLTNKIKILIISACYGAMVSFPAAADDIEIYQREAITTLATQPNVLFILSTSGSMRNPILTRDDYDPLITYPEPEKDPVTGVVTGPYAGGQTCYVPDEVYHLYLTQLSFPRQLSNGISQAERRCQDTNTALGLDGSFFQNAVARHNLSAVTCKGGKEALEASGRYTGRVAQYLNSAWTKNYSPNNLTAFLECEEDDGDHGETTASAAKHASTGGASAWSNDANDTINWAADGKLKTLFTGNYLNYIISAPITQSTTREDILKDVITELASGVSNVNMGLMQFSTNAEGGMVVVPVVDIESSGQRTAIADALIAMDARVEGSPIGETFYEGIMYMQGNAVGYGLNSTSGGTFASPTNPLPSVASSRSGNTYISPISHECQKNHIIIVMDRHPLKDVSSGGGNPLLTNIGSSLTCLNSCTDEFATAIGSEDQSSTFDGKQVISTHTIGFSVESENNLSAIQVLQSTADASLAASGQGKFYSVEDRLGLITVLEELFAGLSDTDASFSSPAVSVNAFNRSTHLDDLYFTLFKPALGPHWPGNLKKYKLAFSVDGNGERVPFIADATSPTPLNAIDPATGFFADTAISYWSADIDADDTLKGGMVNEFQINALLNGGSRNVYTFTGSYSDSGGVFTPDNVNLIINPNKVVDTNNDITVLSDMLDIDGFPERLPGIPRRETLLKWAAGLDVFSRYGPEGSTATDDQRLEMGEPLHSQPALVQYGLDPAVTGDPDLIAYVATNDGYLHAIDVDTGKELFAFIPQELLSNLNTLMDDAGSDKTYGLDGDVVAHIQDNGNDGTITSANGDFVHLYVTMRRGGKNIYSLDVTDRNQPKLRWVIKGGEGDYAEMGQTWSTVNVEQVKQGATEKTVLIFGGGYDTDQDGATVRTADTEGQAVYIADANTGALLWSAGSTGSGADLELSNMDYSIPARVKPLDMSGDGLTDRLYVADMGGQIFRFDIDNNNGSSLSSSVTGGRVANLAGATNIDARRFYYPPDVALVANEGKPPYLALGISSGYRAHPNDVTIQDRIYLIKDFNIYNTPATYVTVTESELFDATLNKAGGEGSEQEQENAVVALNATANRGWFIKLDDPATNAWVGEKGLAEPLILNGALIVTTFTPLTGVDTNGCDPLESTGKAFYLDLFDATPAYPGDNDERNERHVILKKGGIPPSPNVIITGDGVPTTCIGTECSSAGGGTGLRKTFWYEVEQQ